MSLEVLHRVRPVGISVLRFCLAQAVNAVGLGEPGNWQELRDSLPPRGPRRVKTRPCNEGGKATNNVYALGSAGVDVRSCALELRGSKFKQREACDALYRLGAIETAILSRDASWWKRLTLVANYTCELKSG